MTFSGRHDSGRIFPPFFVGPRELKLIFIFI